MEVRAISKDTGISVRKVRPLVDMVRGKTVSEALAMLSFTPTPKAKMLAKLVKSAAASAENNYQMAPSALRIVRIYADMARPMKRHRPRARGRVAPISKDSSHITVVIAEEEA